MSDKALACCGQTFVGVDRWRHVYEVHAGPGEARYEQERSRFLSAVSGAEFKRCVADGLSLPGRG